MNDKISFLFQLCADIARSKGFNVQQHSSQVLLMGTEIGEALELHGSSGNPVIDDYVSRFILLTNEIEAYRKRIDLNSFKDESTIIDLNSHLEELADVFIRIASYVGGNGLTDKFIVALFNKISKNNGRPYLHGKGF